MTKTQAIEWALDDYRRVAGRVLQARSITGYIDDNSVDIDVPHDQPPLRVLVLPMDQSGILHWNDEWLDPYWDVDLVEPHPSIPEGFRTGWLHGTSYNVKTGAVQRDRTLVERAFVRGR